MPTAPRTGAEGSALFRMRNMIVKGRDPHNYVECFGGAASLTEALTTNAVNITGTVSIAAGGTVVTGTGTLFKEELRPGQFLLIVRTTGVDPTHFLVVEEIASNTSMTISKPAPATITAQNAKRLPVLFEVNRKRGSLIHGNAVQFDKGTIICVGEGTLLLNGAVLPGTSLVATRTPKIAIFDPNAATYSVYPLGMTTPASLSAAAVAGGAKGMLAGDYSLFICPARRATNGYNNPSPKAAVTLTATGQKVRLTIPAADTTNGQDAWRIYASTYTEQGGVNGPWYFVKQITALSSGGDVSSAGGTYDLEWNDAEISRNELLTFDNDAPVAAEYVASVAGYPVYVSCQGQGYSSSVTATSPGPFIVPAKPNNIEAAPLKFAVAPSPPEPIIGCLSALGRLYLMTANTLQVAQFVPTSNPNIPPMTIRPYWRSGFKTPQQLCFVDGTLYGFTTQGPTRSIAFGDEGKEEYNFAADVREITSTWTRAHVIVAHDPLNNAICYIHTDDNVVSTFYRTTRILMYGLDQQEWIGDIRISYLESETATSMDGLVTGAATVSGRLELCSGGFGIGTTFYTLRFDQPWASTSVDYYLAWQFTDDGDEMRTKVIKSLRLTAKIGSNGAAKVHGADAVESPSAANIEADTGEKASYTSLNVSSSNVLIGTRVSTNVPNLKVWTMRVSGTWAVASSADRDRIDELVVERAMQGVRR